MRAFRIACLTPPSCRLAAVLHVLYLVFNEGYVASTGAALTRESLCIEAIRLARMTTTLLPQAHEANGLLALMLLIHARRDVRTTADGALMPLADQQRAIWNPALIAEGLDLVRACLRANQPGPYQLQAAIRAVHSDAARADETDWSQILALYDQLLAHCDDG